MPNYFPEGDAAAPADTIERSMAKVVSQLLGALDVLMGEYSPEPMPNGNGEPVTAMIVSGAGTESANGTYLEDGTFNEYPLYTKAGGTSIFDSIYYDISYGWSINTTDEFGEQPFYYEGSALGGSPENFTYIVFSGDEPAPTVTKTTL